MWQRKKVVGEEFKKQGSSPNVLRPLCSFRTLMDSILPPHLRIKGSQKGKVLPPIPKCGRKKSPSD